MTSESRPTLLQKYVLKSLTLCFLLAWVHLSYAQGPGRAYFEKGENFRKQSKCKEAIDSYNQAIRQEPSNYKYYFMMAKCQLQLKYIEEAKNSLEATVEYQPKFTSAYSLLAKIYKEEEDYDQAIYNYEQAARWSSDKRKKIQYELLLVNLLIKQDREEEARRHIESARKLDPSNPKVLFYVGEIASKNENWADAKRAYEKALASDQLKNKSPSEQAKYYYQLGVARNNLGDNTGAKRAWGKANFGPYKKLIEAEMAQNSHVHYYKIAVGYYLNGEYDESERHVNEALNLQRNFSSAYLLKAKIAQKRGNNAGAVDSYLEAIGQEKSPARRSKLYGLMAKLQLKNGDAYGALNSLEKAMQTYPKSSPTYLPMKARAEYDTGDYAASAQTLSALLQANTDPKSKAKHNFMLGMALTKMGDYEQAESAFTRAMVGPYKLAAKEELNKLKNK
ncbi:MAG: tetratricopeptide repeat protein [Bacteroidia bacterium]|nr:tetratricopeptide repeat protein [Bacteroidia bacterium]